MSKKQITPNPTYVANTIESRLKFFTTFSKAMLGIGNINAAIAKKQR